MPAAVTSITSWASTCSASEARANTPMGISRPRSEEHTLNSSHVSISYAVFCLKKKNSLAKRESALWLSRSQTTHQVQRFAEAAGRVERRLRADKCQTGGSRCGGRDRRAAIEAGR